jgi:hypothetical protein
MMICTNPAKELLREAQAAFGKDTEVATIISIGAGKGNVRGEFDHRQEGDGLRRGMPMSEQVHEDMKNRLRNTVTYHRFNVEQEMGIQPEIVFACISAYMKEAATSARVDSAVESIHWRLTGVKLKDISKYKYVLHSGTHRL